MLPDEVLLELSERGGVLGVEMAGAIVNSKKNPIPNLDAYMEQIEYCIDLMGVDHVGCGPDTLYGDHIDLYRSGAKKNKLSGWGHHTRSRESGDQVLGISMNLSGLPDYVQGMENPTESIQNVVRWLIKHGYTDKLITKIIGGNALRLLKKVW
jgi:membrane dipeptidase